MCSILIVGDAFNMTISSVTICCLVVFVGMCDTFSIVVTGRLSSQVNMTW